MKEKPIHAPLWGFEVENGELLVGGMPVSALADKLGRTPFYAYDKALIERRLAELRAAFPADIDLHYAIKANPMPELVRFVSTLVDGLDVASAGELRLAQDTDVAVDHISFAGPGKRDEELALAIDVGVTINLESAGEMRRLSKLGEQAGKTPKVAVRVNPDFELKSSGLRMGGGAKQFGVDAEQVPDLLGEIGAADLEFCGFHIFWGSQSLSVAAIIEAQKNTIELGARLLEHAPATPNFINLGGGLGIPYFPGDKPLDLGQLGVGIARWLPDFRAAFGEARPVLELGRFMVGEAGIYVSRIIDKKISRGRTFLITDGGLHHHLAASGNFGQILRKNYPVAIGNRMDGQEFEQVDIVGCLCTPMDRLGDRVDLPRAEVGDLVVVFQSGAYGLSVSPINFLSHPKPVEVLI